MRQRILVSSTRRSSGMSSAKVDSQYFIGSVWVRPGRAAAQSAPTQWLAWWQIQFLGNPCLRASLSVFARLLGQVQLRGSRLESPAQTRQKRPDSGANCRARRALLPSTRLAPPTSKSGSRRARRRSQGSSNRPRPSPRHGSRAAAKTKFLLETCHPLSIYFSSLWPLRHLHNREDDACPGMT